MTLLTQIAYETAVRVKETFIQHSVTLVDSLPKQAIKMGLDGVNNKFHGGKKVCYPNNLLAKKLKIKT